MKFTEQELRTLVGEIVRGEIGSHLEETRTEQRQWLEDVVKAYGSVRQSTAEERQRDRGLECAKFVLAFAAAKGDPGRAARYAKDKLDHDGIVKAYEKLEAGDISAGGVWVPEEYSSEIIDLLRPLTAIRRLNPTTIPMPTGTVRISRKVSGPSGSYIGERVNIPTSGYSTDMITLTWKKLAGIVPISNDLLMYATPAVESMVRTDLVDALRVREDQAFIRDNGTEHTPKGLRYWVPSANVINANATVNLDNVTADLRDLILVLLEANVPMLRPGWIMAPRTMMYLRFLRDSNGNYVFKDEMDGGTLLGWPYVATTQVPTNLGAGSDESEVYLSDFADVIVGEAGGLRIDSSTEAAYDDSGTVRAAYSRDETLVRVIAHHDFAVRRSAALAVLDQVKWGA